MGIVKGIIFLLILAAAISFAIQNDQPVAVKYYFGWESLPLPVYLWAFLPFFVGLLLSGLMGSLGKVSLHSRIRRQKKGLEQLERKRDSLKTPPPSPQ